MVGGRLGVDGKSYPWNREEGVNRRELKGEG